MGAGKSVAVCEKECNIYKFFEYIAFTGQVRLPSGSYPVLRKMINGNRRYDEGFPFISEH